MHRACPVQGLPTVGRGWWSRELRWDLGNIPCCRQAWPVDCGGSDPLSYFLSCNCLVLQTHMQCALSVTAWSHLWHKPGPILPSLYSRSRRAARRRRWPPSIKKWPKGGQLTEVTRKNWHGVRRDMMVSHFGRTLELLAIYRVLAHVLPKVILKNYVAACKFLRYLGRER